MPGSLAGGLLSSNATLEHPCCRLTCEKAPSLGKYLQDQRLIFRLKKQEVVEHLRKGTPEAQQHALGEIPLHYVCPSSGSAEQAAMYATCPASMHIGSPILLQL